MKKVLMFFLVGLISVGLSSCVTMKHRKGVPPGLAKKGGVPPGLAKKGKVPPGHAKKTTGDTVIVINT